jgi:hypothetical protein
MFGGVTHDALVFAVAVGFIIYIGVARAEHRRRDRIGKRKEIELMEFIMLCRAELAIDPNALAALLNSIATAIGVKPGQLRPTDRIEGDLIDKFWGLDDEVNLVVDDFLRTLDPKAQDGAPQRVRTLSDLAVLCATRSGHGTSL